MKSVNRVLADTRLKESRRISDQSCRHCRGTGWAIKVAMQNNARLEYAERCGCWKKVRQKSFQANLPTELQKMTLESFDFTRVESREVFKDMFLHPGRGYLLVGPYGAGKTHLLIGLYLKAALLAPRTVYCTARQLMNWLQDEAMSEPTLIMRLAKSPEPFHLFWDDIDKMKVTESRKEMLFDLLDSMVANGHKISLTSNVQLKDLAGTSFFRGDAVRRLEAMSDAEIVLMPRR